MTPEAQVEYIEKDAIFHCRTKIQAIWTFQSNHSFPPNVHILDTENIKIESITRENKGFYECKGTTEDDYVFYALARLKVIGMTIPFIGVAATL